MMIKNGHIINDSYDLYLLAILVVCIILLVIAGTFCCYYLSKRIAKGKTSTEASLPNVATLNSPKQT